MENTIYFSSREDKIVFFLNLIQIFEHWKKLVEIGKK